MANEKDRSVWVFRLSNDPVGVRPIEDEVRPIEDEVADALQRQDKALMASREEEHVSAVPIYGAPIYVMPAKVPVGTGFADPAYEEEVNINVSAVSAYGGAPPLDDDHDYEFDVCLEDYSQATLTKVVQVVRRVLPMDLAKAVTLVKSTPVVLASKVSISDALELESEFTKVGAQVRVVNSYTKEVVRA